MHLHLSLHHLKLRPRCRLPIPPLADLQCFDWVGSPKLPKEEHEDKSGEISEHEKVDVLGKIIPTMEMAEEKPLVSKRVNSVSKKEKKELSTKIIRCKKNDGRNWFCKRPAKQPYNLCEHHLAQSRSYKEISCGSVGCKTKKQKETGEFYSSEYYYYGTVTLSRGKRRSARNADGSSTSTAIDVKEEKMHNKDVLGGQKECCVSGSNTEEEVNIGAQRARKLVKYRSLDSLPEAEP
ncbi:hypothetical protein FCM35_KLT13302 [Carex littledalei]|uniref:WRC domain-containing protein n=1 Tax=Carex littledalei TaxID=544730 RepID=A0A833QLY5_9POAL|nr:hypothetical protein FCM35_KLT13302 [Carex littledalei]